MDQIIKNETVTKTENGASIITPATSKDAPKVVEAAHTPSSAIKSEQESINSLIAKMKANQKAKEQAQQQNVIAQESKKEVSKFDSVVSQTMEDRKKLIKEKQALAQKQKEFEAAQKAIADLESAKSNPLEWLKKGGMSYEQLVEHMVNNPDSLTDKDKELLQLKAKVESFEKKLTEKEQAEEEQKRQQTWQQFYTTVKNSIDDEAKKSDYELLRVTQSYEPLIDRLAARWNETGVTPDIHEVAQEHEADLIKYALDVVKNSAKLQQLIRAEVFKMGKDQPVTDIPKAKPTLSNQNATPPSSFEIPVKSTDNDASIAQLFQETKQRMIAKGTWPGA